MRPQILFPLFAAITSLPGIGPKLAKLVEKVAGAHVVNLLWHLPYALIDRRYAPTLIQAEAGRIATVQVAVDEHQVPRNPRQPYRVLCHDATGSLTLVFFHARGDYLAKLLPVGEKRVVSGRIELFQNTLQMTHPDHVVPLSERDSVMRVEPVYGLTAGLAPKTFMRAIHHAVDNAPELAEWIDPALLKRETWPAWKAALIAAHNPTGDAELSTMSVPRRRLAYDELLAHQLAIAMVRNQNRALPGRRLKGDGKLQAKVKAALPYTLTGSQIQGIAEIAADMDSDTRMLRLLQGDVGSGKTVVALFAMLVAAEAKTQAALMAPTEILARQHFATLQPLAEAAGCRIVLLTGRDKGKARVRILEGLADGAIQMVVGTHALVQDDVEFNDLGLAVIDEQHRFGVHQRLTLASKGKGVHMLVMTATPIPRTLMLAAYGDMDASRLTEKPAGRKPIDTRTVQLERLDEVVDAVGRRVKEGARVYWVCPLIEESEVSDMAAAEERHAMLRGRYGERVGMVHGRMKGSERDKVMEAFASGHLDILVATTVIEVGVDVPQATVMVIEHAERFGLSQLHQLRGRVGRGDAASTCLLLYQNPLGETAKSRLSIMRETEDGFRIAEEDLRLRGAGELLGTRQSGLPEMRLADLAVHGDLLQIARDDARLILERDSKLANKRGEALRTLLYLFERDAGVKTLQSG
ncbi:MAG: ATP-dependent helicase RecG [Alphaproteobacteria bacterium]|jgi:ATP-dependent DNA helicase RecG|nr:ATP-dependent helicase RecG [Alphaproteobacteria bacterium]